MSVRRAVAIQLIINRELGLNKNQNPLQGSFAIEYLTDLLEEAVYREFDSISERGGVLADGVGHKYAQAYGMFLLSAFSAGAAVSAILIRSRAHVAASRTTGSWCSSARLSAGSACG